MLQHICPSNEEHQSRSQKYEVKSYNSLESDANIESVDEKNTLNHDLPQIQVVSLTVVIQQMIIVLGCWERTSEWFFQPVRSKTKRELLISIT